MKKFLFMFLAVLIITLFVPISSIAQDSDICIKVNGEIVNFDVKPFIENNKTYIPVRGVFEKLGAKVIWKDIPKEIIIWKGRTVVSLKANNMWTVINDKAVEAGATPKIVNGRAFVPVRFVSETLGATVTWDQQTRTIDIAESQVDDSEKSILPLLHLPERVAAETLPNPTGNVMFPDIYYICFPPQVMTPEETEISQLEAKLNLIISQISGTNQCIENLKKQISEGMDLNILLEQDLEKLKELETSKDRLIKELKEWEEKLNVAASELL